MQRFLEDGSPARNNTPAILNSTHLSGAMARDTIAIFSVASPEPQILTIESDFNEPKIQYGFGNQHLIVPPNLNGPNLPTSQFNVFSTTVVIQSDEYYGPQSPESSDPSPISKPPMNLSTIEGWETPLTITDDAEVSSKDEPIRVI